MSEFEKAGFEETFDDYTEGLTVAQVQKIYRLLRVDPSQNPPDLNRYYELTSVLRWYQAFRHTGADIDIENLCFNVKNLPCISSISQGIDWIKNPDKFIKNKTDAKLKYETKDKDPEQVQGEDVITRFHRLEII